MSRELQHQKVDRVIRTIVKNAEQIEDIVHADEEYYFVYRGKHFVVARWRDSHGTNRMAYRFDIVPNYVGTSDNLADRLLSADFEEGDETYRAVSFDSLDYPTLPIHVLYDAVKSKCDAIDDLLEEILEEDEKTGERSYPR